MNESRQGSFRWIRILLLIIGLLGSQGRDWAADASLLADLRAAAAAGDGQAQDKLAEAYRAQFDHAQANFWYRKAAAQGVANSQYQLAETLIYEATSPRESAESRKSKAAEGVALLRRAAQQDHPRAQLHLGRHYQEGILVAQDYVEAFKWFTIVSKDGSIDPVSREGRRYRDMLIQRMTAPQIAEAEAAARSFLAGPPPTAENVQSDFVKDLTLQRIDGTGGPQAIINGETFAVGEGGVVKVGAAWVYITCLDILTNSARIKLEETGLTVDLRIGEESAPQVNSPPALDQPAKEVRPEKPQPEKPSHPRVYPEKQRYAAAPVPTTPDRAEMYVILWRKLASAAACVAVFVGLLVVGYVVAVPMLRKAVIAPSHHSVWHHSPDSPSSLFQGNEFTLDPNSCVSRERLIRQLRTLESIQFKKLVELILRKRSYEVQDALGREGHLDEGIDLFADKHGKRHAVQCNHCPESEVSVGLVAEFLRVLRDAGFEKGIIVALGGFTAPARKLADKHGIETFDPFYLAVLLKEVDAQNDAAIIELMNGESK